MRTTHKKAAALLIGAVFLSSCLAAVIAPAASSSPPLPAVRLGLAPAVPSSAQVVGAVPSAKTLTVDVTLDSQDPAGLSAFAQDVSTPGSPEYHHYLSTAQFAAEFGASDDAINSVESTLRQQGLTIGAVSANQLSLQATGSTATIEQTFSTGINSYELASGRTAFANTSAPLIPGSIANDVQGVIGLNNLVQAQHASLTAVPTSATTSSSVTGAAATGGAQPCTDSTNFTNSRMSQQGYFAYGYNQIASAYGLSSLYNEGDFGQGITVAIVEFEADVTNFSTFRQCYGVDTSVTDVQVDGGSSGGNGLETALDIDTVAALAPQASIAVYQAPNTDQDVYDDYSAIINAPHHAQVLSSSWGECEADWDRTVANSEYTLFEQAAAEGITVLSASGDQGSEGCNYSPSLDPTDLAVADPASQPYVTGVGGTTLTFPDYPTSLANPSETTWNDSGSGDGGLSLFWPMPWYQSGASSALGVVNPTYSYEPNTASVSSTTNSQLTISTSDIGCNTQSPVDTKCREIPDVSADANPLTGYAVYWSGQWEQVGGTSAATPLWAAIVALADASPTCDNNTVGFINPALYDIAGSSLYASALNDITTGNNAADSQSPQVFPALPNYDMATGLGTPHANVLAPLLCEESVNANAGNDGLGSAPIITGLSATAGVANNIETVNGFNLTGATSVLFGSSVGTNVSVNANGQSLTVTVPTAPSGPQTADVEVTTSSGSSPTSALDQFTYGVPTVTSIAASTSPSAVGDTAFSISGTGFSHATAVTFGTSTFTVPSYDFTVNSDSSITVTPPPQAAGSVDVTVSNADGTSATFGVFTYGNPVVSSVTPVVALPGTSMAITGTGFLSVPPTGAVSFGGISVTYNVVSDTEINNIVVPNLALYGSTIVDIVVSSPTGESVESTNNQFTYPAPNVTAVSPDTGTLSELATPSITLTGTGFEGVPPGGGVSFGGTPVTYNVVSDTEIDNISAPANAAGTVHVIVTNPSGSSTPTSGPGGDQFTYGAPTVASVSPNFGPSTFTTSNISITGTGFANIASTGDLSFDGIPASYNVASDTLIDNITAPVPVDTAGTIDVTVTNAQGTSTIVNGDKFTYFDPPSVTAISPDSGTIAGGTSITITGSGFTHETQVVFGTSNATQVVVNSDTSLTAISPVEAAGLTDVVVTNPAGSSTENSADEFSFVAPTVSSAPSGPSSGSGSGSGAGTSSTPPTTIAPAPVTTTPVGDPTPTTSPVTPAASTAGLPDSRITQTSTSKASASASSVSASDAIVVANGSSSSTITVHLKQSNGNSVAKKRVQLHASSGHSVIQTVSATTSSKGMATFKVVDKYAEQVKYSATDTTDNVNVSQHVIVTFVVMASATKSRTVTTCHSPTGPASTVVTIRSASGAPLFGRSVTLSKTSSFQGTLSDPTSITTTNGTASFSLSSHIAQKVTFAVHDTTDNLTLSPITVTFGESGSCQ